VNQRFWRGLPTVLRETLEGALRDATTYANQIAEAENRAALASIAASGRIVIATTSPKELASWRNATAPTERSASAWISAETLKSVVQAAGTPP
jgi:C4-dicarboxylate-binding protein DctP